MPKLTYRGVEIILTIKEPAPSSYDYSWAATVGSQTLGNRLGRSSTNGGYFALLDAINNVNSVLEKQ